MGSDAAGRRIPDRRRATATAAGRAAAGLLAALLLLASPPPADAGPPPEQASAGGIPRDAEFLGRVDRAIDQGVKWITAATPADGALPEHGGYPCGVQALAYHTLRVCGVPRDDPAARAVWGSLRKRYAEAGRSNLQTYSAALVLMAIAEHGERVQAPDREVRLDEADRRWAEEVTRFLVRGQNADGTWSYRGEGTPYGKARTSAYDHSNTQYALLGLKAAARCGVPIEPRVWVRSLEHFLDTQEADGPGVPRFDPDAGAAKGRTASAVRDRARGWGYVGQGTAYGSMTAGGVGSVVLCRSELIGTPAMPKTLEARSEASLRDGLAWLGRSFTVHTNPGPRATMAGSSWHLYYLYAVERAGILAGVDWMGDRDWYGEGADFLCEVQAEDGGWWGMATADLPGPPGRPRAGGGRPQRRRDDRLASVPVNSTTAVDVCFALLFLKRGTVAVRRGSLTQAADDSDIRFDAAVSLTGQDFADFVDLVLLRWRRSEDAGVRARLFEGATRVGPKIVEPLLLRMDSRDEEERAAAHALLRHATGVDHGYDASAARGDREAAVVQWQGWWLLSKDRLAYDPATKRLVAR